MPVIPRLGVRIPSLVVLSIRLVGRHACGFAQAPPTIAQRRRCFATRNNYVRAFLFDALFQVADPRGQRSHQFVVCSAAPTRHIIEYER